MIDSSVLIVIARELCDASAPHTLESLTCLLTAVGATFDQPAFIHHAHLQTIFAQVEKKSNDASITARIRFLLKDLLDLRESRWKSTK